MSEFQEIEGAKFEEDVLQSEKPVLLEFSAVWCSPCKALEPIMKDLASEWSDEVVVAKLDVDHNPDIAQNYQVLSVPTTILFKGGEALERMVGFQPKDKITGKVQPHLQPA